MRRGQLQEDLDLEDQEKALHLLPKSLLITSASTLEKKILKEKNHTGNIETAKIIGKVIAERAIAEIARSEWYREGRVPLHTFRANVFQTEEKQCRSHFVMVLHLK